jgi:hypothetical protein
MDKINASELFDGDIVISKEDLSTALDKEFANFPFREGLFELLKPRLINELFK